MNLLKRLNKRLVGLTGFEIRRAAVPETSPTTKRRGGKAASSKLPQVEYRPPQDLHTDRLLRRPVFIIAPVRSGSTMLRLLLNAHSQLHSPHELHVRRLEVGLGTRLGEKSMAKLDLDRGDLEHLLWDRVMHRELVKSGKDFIVEKTPSNAFAYQRIAAAWPDARYIFLLRHPDSIAKSWHEADPKKRDATEAASDSLRYMRAVERARSNLSGYTVRYEDLTADPQTTMKGICQFLGVNFEPEMLDYGKSTSGKLTKGLGDWKEKIRSGSVQPGRVLPTSAAEIPEPLREISQQWGYIDSGQLATPVQRHAETHAEVAQIWPKHGKIRIIGEIVGEAVGSTRSQWRLSLVLRGHPERVVEVPVALPGETFDVSVSVDDLVPPEDMTQPVWDAFFVAADDKGETRLRLGKHLDDIADKADIMVYPEQAATQANRSVSVKPAYTLDNYLIVECELPDAEPSSASGDQSKVGPRQ